MRNAEVHLHVSDAERARRAGDPGGAYDGFVEAGHCAERYGLWKTALRCYRNAVELDLHAPRAVGELARVAPRAGAGGEWADYAAAVAAVPPWPRVICRDVQLLIGTSGAIAHCARVGTVLELVMTADDHVDVRPEARFANIPVAMALIILRRALWPAPRETATQSYDVRVTYRGRHAFRLLEHGDWLRL